MASSVAPSQAVDGVAAVLRTHLASMASSVAAHCRAGAHAVAATQCRHTTQVLQDKDQQIDINRKKAVDVMRACFKPILPDQGAKLLHRVQNLPPPSVSRNPKCIDLDDLLELTHNTWANTSSNWRTHLEFLYARHANLYRVKEEMRFANDNGILSQDVILVQEERAKNYTLRDARRPLYDLQQQGDVMTCLLYTSPSPRDRQKSRMPSSA